MKYYLSLIVLSCTTVLHAQDFIAKPYVFAGPELMGGGYAPVAFLGGVGARVDSKWLIFDSRGWYDNGHKTDDNDQPNPKGHDRGLEGSAYFRLPSGWAFGAGARWSQLLTTNYKKSGWRPTFGGSKDFFVRDCVKENCAGRFTMRIGADYVMKGTDWENGQQGVLLSFFMPSPSVKRHIFYQETIGIYRFHDTVTDRTDAVLTAEESSHHHPNSFAEFTIMYRF